MLCLHKTLVICLLDKCTQVMIPPLAITTMHNESCFLSSDFLFNIPSIWIVWLIESVTVLVYIKCNLFVCIAVII